MAEKEYWFLNEAGVPTRVKEAHFDPKSDRVFLLTGRRRALVLERRHVFDSREAALRADGNERGYFFNYKGELEPCTLRHRSGQRKAFSLVDGSPIEAYKTIHESLVEAWGHRVKMLQAGAKSIQERLNQIKKELAEAKKKLAAARKQATKTNKKRVTKKGTKK